MSISELSRKIITPLSSFKRVDEYVAPEPSFSLLKRWNQTCFSRCLIQFEVLEVCYGLVCAREIGTNFNLLQQIPDFYVFLMDVRGCFHLFPY